MSTLWDILCRPIPASLQPECASKKIAASTRDISRAEATVKMGNRLHAVVYYEGLLEPLLQEGQRVAEKVKLVNLDKKLLAQWESHVDYTGSAFMLPPFINSEMDSTSWFNQVLARPALAAVNLVQDTGRDLRSAFAPTAAIVPPYLISAQHLQNMPVPDELLMKGGSKNANAAGNTAPRTVIELKTGNALETDKFLDLFETRLDDDDKLIAIPVVYPGKNRKKDKPTKILFQLWAQMQKHDCDYGLLSSYHATIFAYRRMQYEEVKGKRRRVNVMVLSDMYEIGATSSSHMFSWFLHALKASRVRVPLPSVNLNLALDFMSSKKVKQAEKKKGVNFKFAVGPQISYTDEVYFEA